MWKLIAVAVFLVGCTHGQHVAYHRVMLVETTAVIACDYGQTMWASNGGAWDRSMAGRPWLRLREANPMLGAEPAGSTIAIASAAGAMAGLVIYKLPIPNWAKSAYFTAVGLAETGNVIANARNGRMAGGSGICGLP